jgi:hypothetical protein
MGILTKIEDPSANTVLYTFVPGSVSQDMGFKRRSGTYTISGADWGLDPYGSLAAPLDINTFTYGFSVEIPYGGDVDAARAALLKVVGPGRPVRLVYVTDDGHEQVCTAKCMGVQEVITPDSRWLHPFVVTWEKLEHWRDRYARSGKTWGQTNPVLVWGVGGNIWGNTTTPFTSASQFVNVVADGSDSLRTPTADDTWLTVFLTGPLGSDVTIDANGNYTGGGIVVGNTTAKTPDFSGNPVAIQFTFYGKLGPLDTLAVDCAAQSVLLNGAPAYKKFLTPAWQSEWARVKAGVVNVFNIGATGANPVYTSNAVQPVALLGNPSSGTFKLTIITADGVSHLSDTISWADSAATFKTHIATNATPAISGSDVSVTGGPFPNAPIFVEFTGANAGKPIKVMVASASTLSGPATPQIVIGPGTRDTASLALTGNPTGGGFSLSAITPAPGSVTQTTAIIPWNATAVQVFNALAVLTALNGGVGLGVSGGPLPNLPITISTAGPLTGVVFTAFGSLANGILTGGGTGSTSAVLQALFGNTATFSLNWYGRYWP